MLKKNPLYISIAVFVALVALGALVAWLYTEDNSTVVSALSKVGISKSSTPDSPDTTVAVDPASTTSTIEDRAASECGIVCGGY